MKKKFKIFDSRKFESQFCHRDIIFYFKKIKPKSQKNFQKFYASIQSFGQKNLIFSTNKVSRAYIFDIILEKKKGKFCEIFDDFFILENKFRSYHHDDTISFHEDNQKNKIFFLFDESFHILVVTKI